MWNSAVEKADQMHVEFQGREPAERVSPCPTRHCPCGSGVLQDLRYCMTGRQGGGELSAQVFRRLRLLVSGLVMVYED